MHLLLGAALHLAKAMAGEAGKRLPQPDSPRALGKEGVQLLHLQRLPGHGGQGHAPLCQFLTCTFVNGEAVQLGRNTKHRCVGQGSPEKQNQEEGDRDMQMCVGLGERETGRDEGESY